jgi:hypothetical protein
VPVHVARHWTGGSAPFVHTRSLRGGALTAPRHSGPMSLASRGPFILLPRVGRFSPDKVVYGDVGRVVLSDCVFGLRMTSGSGEALVLALRENENMMAAAYQGSCAPYLTIARLRSVLARIGIRSEHVRA